jgi:hypothetical protein
MAATAMLDRGHGKPTDCLPEQPEQPTVIDPNKTVAQTIAELGLTEAEWVYQLGRQVQSMASPLPVFLVRLSATW